VSQLLRRHWLTISTAIGLFAAALAGGAYALGPRSVVGMLAWGAVILWVALALSPRVRVQIPTAAKVVVAALGALAALTLLSIAWSASAENAFIEFDRIVMYVGLLVATLMLRRRGRSREVLDGLAIGIVAITALAVATRCFPNLINTGSLATYLPSAATRLSYPVQYWNGLAIFAGLSLPLLFSVAVGDRPAWLSALALAPVPLIAATIFLASSRGGAAVALVGAVAFVLLCPRRLLAASTAIVAAASAAASVAVLHGRGALANGPLHSHAAITQGRSAAAVLVVLCAMTFAIQFLLKRVMPADLRLPAQTARIVAGVVAVAVVAGIVVADPVRLINDFKRPPSTLLATAPDFVQAHLLSGNGSGRWQFWGAAWHEFTAHPLLGNGAGSYEAWWAQHGTLSMFVRNAHSLYLDTLGELGILGFVALVMALGTGVVAGARRLRALDGQDRLVFAALLAAFLAFLVAAGFDWIWQLTAVGAIGIVLLGLLVGPATAGPFAPRDASTDRSSAPWRRSFGLGIAVLALAWVLVCAQVYPWIVQQQISASQASVRRGDLIAARERALAARALQPWAPSPYLQLALVDEAAGHLDSARIRIGQAIQHNNADWRLWLVSARIYTEAREISNARTSLARARQLNPHLPLFASTGA
jgi:hypothetical protein